MLVGGRRRLCAALEPTIEPTAPAAGKPPQHPDTVAGRPPRILDPGPVPAHATHAHARQDGSTVRQLQVDAALHAAPAHLVEPPMRAVVALAGERGRVLRRPPRRRPRALAPGAVLDLFGRPAGLDNRQFHNSPFYFHFHDANNATEPATAQLIEPAAQFQLLGAGRRRQFGGSKRGRGLIRENGGAISEKRFGDTHTARATGVIRGSSRSE